MGSKKTTTTTDTTPKETALSRKQLDILKHREALYQDFTIPYLEGFLDETSESLVGEDQSFSTFAEGGLAQVHQNFDVSQNNLKRSLAQRGLEGSGVQANSLAQLSFARQDALANTANSARLDQAIHKENITRQNQSLKRAGLAALVSQSPRPTQAAPTGTVTTQTQKSGSGAGAIVGGIAGAVLAPVTGGASLALGRVGSALDG